MPGDPSAMLVGYPAAATGSPPVAGPGSTGSVGDLGFVFWLALIGVVIPALIIGGLQVGGFSFVFRHR